MHPPSLSYSLLANRHFHFRLLRVVPRLLQIIELGDTVFLVMRRREVPLLHWYHHMITIFFVWNAWAEGVENGSAAQSPLRRVLLWSW